MTIDDRDFFIEKGVRVELVIGQWHGCYLAWAKGCPNPADDFEIGGEITLHENLGDALEEAVNRYIADIVSDEEINRGE